MRIIPIRRCTGELQKILKAAQQEEFDVVLKPAHGEEILLSLIDDFDYEIAAQRRNPKLMAFLDRKREEARKSKGIPWETVKQRLGLGSITNNQRQHNSKPFALKRIEVSARSQALSRLLEQARSEDVIVKAGARECLLSAVRGRDDKSAIEHGSKVVAAYLDELGEQGKLPPLEVVFVDKLPAAAGGKKPRRHNKMPPKRLPAKAKR